MKTKKLSLHKPLYEAEVSRSIKGGNFYKEDLENIKSNCEKLISECQKFYGKYKNDKQSGGDLSDINKKLEELLERF